MDEFTGAVLQMSAFVHVCFSFVSSRLILFFPQSRAFDVSSGWCESYLDEANVGGLLTEALTADVETVLADETGLVGADTAGEKTRQQTFQMPLEIHVYPMTYQLFSPFAPCAISRS